MSSDAKKNFKHNPDKGMWNCQIIGKTIKDKDGEEEDLIKVYHASTANTLQTKGYLKILSKVKKYIPKTMEQ